MHSFVAVRPPAPLLSLPPVVKHGQKNAWEVPARQCPCARRRRGENGRLSRGAEAVSADRGFIDRVHAFDEAAFRKGELTPTHMMAVLTPEACEKAVYARGLGPEESVRRRIVSRLVRSAIVRVKEAIGRA